MESWPKDTLHKVDCGEKGEIKELPALRGVDFINCLENLSESDRKEDVIRWMRASQPYSGSIKEKVQMSYLLGKIYFQAGNWEDAHDAWMNSENDWREAFPFSKDIEQSLSFLYAVKRLENQAIQKKK